jgi:hypothetical protein
MSTVGTILTLIFWGQVVRVFQAAALNLEGVQSAAAEGNPLILPSNFYGLHAQHNAPQLNLAIGLKRKLFLNYFSAIHPDGVGLLRRQTIPS